MAVEWSDTILIANLADEPALSDELALICEKVEAAGQPPHAVLDFAEVSYINSSNIAQLLRLRKLLDASSRSMRLSGVTDDVMSVLMVTGLDKVFKFAPDTLTALAGLQLSDAD
jgi:anti-anti-sigma factor|tara:strand:- start:1308 stop:1649 length:342 start_codon:yes stop_codon:yes gene_type:complete